MIEHMSGIVFAVVALALMGMAFWSYTTFYNMVFKVNFINEVAGGNTAASLRITGLTGSLLLGVLGLMFQDPVGGVLENALLLLEEGLALFVLMIIALYINEHMIITGINNTGAVMKNNIAVGLTELGGSIATALVASGSLTNNVDPIKVVTFFVLGQIAMVSMVWIYSVVTRIQLVEQIRQGNIAAGLKVCGILIAYGLLLRGAVVSDGGDWEMMFQEFSVRALMGTFFLLIWGFLIDLIILPKVTNHEAITNRQVGPVIITVLAQIAGSALIVNSIM